MKTYGLYESAAVKIQTLKTAIESATLLLRVDDVVSARREFFFYTPIAPPPLSQHPVLFFRNGWGPD